MSFSASAVSGSEQAVRGPESRPDSSRPWIKLDYVVKNESAAHGDYNAYIRSFCRDRDLIKCLYEVAETNTAVLKLLNKQDLKKELTECYSAICLVERSLRRRAINTDKLRDLNSRYCTICDNSTQVPTSSPAGITGDFEWDQEEPLLTFSAIRANMANLVFYDVCSGKGILSFLLAILFTEIPKIVMIDSNADMKLDHLQSECCKMVSYRNCDIYSEDFSAFLVSESIECSLLERVPIVIGLHLCGTLSTRLTDLFNCAELLPLMIISPCCAPTRSKKKKVFMTREKLRKNKWSSYDFWYMSVYVSICPVQTVRNVIRDDLVLSEKNTLIVAMKRNFLTL